MYIAFEGPDGSGKSTQSALIYSYLASQNKEVIYTKEPQDDELGKIIRTTLTKSGHNFSDFKDKLKEEQFLHHLFMAARIKYQFSTDGIQDQLNQGKIILQDRSFLSNLVYNTPPLNEENFLPELYNAIKDNDIIIKPDIIFYFKLDVKKALERVKKRDGDDTDKYENEIDLKNIINKYNFFIENKEKYLSGIRIIEIEIQNYTIEEIHKIVKNNIDLLI